MRVSISPKGSDMDMEDPLSLPARLDHAGDLPGAGEIAQRDAAQPELPVVRARAAADLTTQTDPRWRTVARQLSQFNRSLEPLFHRKVAVLDNRLQRRTLGLVAGRHLHPLGVAVDLGSFGHPVLPSGTYRPSIRWRPWFSKSRRVKLSSRTECRSP